MNRVRMQLFLVSQNEAVCCDPGSRFHGWLFRRHADGSFVSDRKLQEASPYPINHPLAALIAASRPLPSEEGSNG